MPSAEDPCLANAGEKAYQILVVQDEITMFRGLTPFGQESVHVASSKMLWASNWNELENHPGQDVKHGPEW